MSEEQKVSQTEEKGDEVEGHSHRIGQNDEATDDGDEVEAHGRLDGRVDGRSDNRQDKRVD